MLIELGVIYLRNKIIDRVIIQHRVLLWENQGRRKAGLLANRTCATLPMAIRIA